MRRRYPVRRSFYVLNQLFTLWALYPASASKPFRPDGIARIVHDSEMRHIRLTFETGESVLAELLEEDAPAVCRFVWEMLPYEREMIHGMYSGAEVFGIVDNPPQVPEQNLTQIPLPGEIFYFYDPGLNTTSRKGGVGEICIAYNRGVIFRGPEGAPTYASLFARIPGDWKRDWVDFQKACRAVRWEGPRRLRIERA